MIAVLLAAWALGEAIEDSLPGYLMPWARGLFEAVGFAAGGWSPARSLRILAQRQL